MCQAALDIGAPPGTDVYSPVDGQVTVPGCRATTAAAFPPGAYYHVAGVVSLIAPASSARAELPAHAVVDRVILFARGVARLVVAGDRRAVQFGVGHRRSVERARVDRGPAPRCRSRAFQAIPCGRLATAP